MDGELLKYAKTFGTLAMVFGIIMLAIYAMLQSGIVMFAWLLGMVSFGFGIFIILAIVFFVLKK